jgi:hypothetical protein
VLTRIDEDKAETRVTIGYPLEKVMGRQHASLLVLATMLDHQLGAVRETMGRSHGVHARLSVDWPRIEIVGELDGHRSGEALAAILAAVVAVGDPADFDRRFVHARRRVLQGLLEQQDDPDGFAELVAMAVRNDRSIEYFRALAREVAKVTPDDVRARYQQALVDQLPVTLIEGPSAGVDSATMFDEPERVQALD